MLSRVEAVGYVENDKDVQIVSELMGDVRDAVTDYQVSGYLEKLHVPPHSSKIVLDEDSTNDV